MSGLFGVAIREHRKKISLLKELLGAETILGPLLTREARDRLPIRRVLNWHHQCVEKWGASGVVVGKEKILRALLLLSGSGSSSLEQDLWGLVLAHYRGPLLWVELGLRVVVLLCRIFRLRISRC